MWFFIKNHMTTSCSIFMVMSFFVRLYVMKNLIKIVNNNAT